MVTWNLTGAPSSLHLFSPFTLRRCMYLYSPMVSLFNKVFPPKFHSCCLDNYQAAVGSFQNTWISKTLHPGASTSPTGHQLIFHFPKSEEWQNPQLTSQRFPFFLAIGVYRFRLVLRTWSTTVMLGTWWSGTY